MRKFFFCHCPSPLDGGERSFITIYLQSLDGHWRVFTTIQLYFVNIYIAFGWWQKTFGNHSRCYWCWNWCGSQVLQDPQHFKCLTFDDMNSFHICCQWLSGFWLWLHNRLKTNSVQQIIITNVAQHVFGLAVHGNYLYWTDWILRGVIRANKYTGKQTNTQVNKQIHR